MPSSHTPELQSAKYRPDIDGLRALAVLPVLLFHAKFGFSGGFVGVDIFFVISGYLISTIILKELSEGTFSLIAFWERRIRRILPTLTAVVFATLVVGWLLYLPEEFQSVGKSVVAQATLLSNVFFLRHTGYFTAGDDLKPLLHTWSLAVEEQFYLFFPLLLVLLTRRKKTYLTKIIFALAAFSFALSVVGSHTHPWATFYLLPTRAWELLIGTLLVMAHGRFSENSRLRESSGWLGLGLVCYSIFSYDSNMRFPGMAAFPPCLGAAMIIFSSETRLSIVGRILAFKPLVFVGLISYSLYLWHWPLLVFSSYLAKEEQGPGFRASLLIISFFLALLSWKFIETPFRKRLLFKQRHQIFGFAGVSLVTLLAIGLFVNYREGLPSRFPPASIRYAESRYHRAFLNRVSLKQALAGHFVELGSGETNQPVSLMVWGDSHAMAVTPVLDDLCRKFSLRGLQATHPSTAPVLGYQSTSAHSLKEESSAFADSVLTYISEKKVKNVIIAAYWIGYPIADAFKTNLPSTVQAILSLGTKVYVLKDVPIPGFDVPRLAAITSMYNGDLEELGIAPQKHETLNREMNQTFEQIERMGATVLDPSQYFMNSKGLYGVIRNDVLLYRDDDHLTIEGSRLLAPLFEPIFQPE